MARTPVCLTCARRVFYAFALPPEGVLRQDSPPRLAGVRVAGVSPSARGLSGPVSVPGAVPGTCEGPKGPVSPWGL